MKTTYKKLPKSEIEIDFEISAEEFKKHVDQAIAHLKEHIKVNGFRPGQAPTKIVEERAGKENILMEAGDLAVKECYSKFVLENNLEPISSPDVKIIKIPARIGYAEGVAGGAEGNPFLFNVKVTILPEVELPDYAKIVANVKKQEVSVSSEEITDTLNYLQKSRAKFSQIDRPAAEKDFVEIKYYSPQFSTKKIDAVKSAPKSVRTDTFWGNVPPESPAESEQFDWITDQFILGEGGFVPGFEKNLVGMKTNEKKEFSVKFPANYAKKEVADKDVKFKVKVLSVQKVELPDINDDFAKNLGRFENLEALRTNVKNGIWMEKEGQEKEKQRNEMIERIAEKVKVEIPEVLVKFEKENLFSNFQKKITNDYKISWQDYLATIKKDEKEIMESFLKEAEKRAKNFLIMKALAKKENVAVSDSEVEEEMNKTIKNYPADLLKKIDINELKSYTKGVMYNEKVFKNLEKLIK